MGCARVLIVVSTVLGASGAAIVGYDSTFLGAIANYCLIRLAVVALGLVVSAAAATTICPAPVGIALFEDVIAALADIWDISPLENFRV